MTTVTKYPAQKPHHKPTRGEASQFNGHLENGVWTNAKTYPRVGLSRNAPRRKPSAHGHGRPWPESVAIAAKKTPITRYTPPTIGRTWAM